MKTKVLTFSRFWVTAAMLLLVNSGITRAQDRLAITDATIIPIVGERIENGTILISNGRIEAVGKDIDIPIEAKVIDASGHVVMPGICLLYTSPSPRDQRGSRMPSSA